MDESGELDHHGLGLATAAAAAVIDSAGFNSS